ncbi:MAG: N-formylglutamate deformylase [Sneathiella sp.]
MSETYTLTQRSSPLLLSQPHVGLEIPADIMSRLTANGSLKADTDWHIDRLYKDIAKSLDATVLTATHSRYVIDLNRDPSGTSLYPGQSVTELCPTSVFDDSPLYKDNNTPDETEIKNRRVNYWQPYHDALLAEINRIREIHGFALLFDCHSIRSVLPRFFEGRLPTLNLGTGNGSATVPELEQVLEKIAAESAYSHALNGRFKGGFITRNYGNPNNDVHAVQLELAQEDYMEEIPPFSYQEEKAHQLQPTLKKLLQAMLDWANETYRPE